MKTSTWRTKTVDLAASERRQIPASGNKVFVAQADFSFSLSLDGQNFIPWKAGRILASQDSLVNIWIRNDDSWDANTVKIIFGTGDLLESKGYENPSTICLGYEDTLANNGTKPFLKKASEAAGTPSVGPKKRYNRKSIQFFNLGAGDLNLMGSNGGYIGVVKAGTTSPVFETDDTITVENLSGAGVKFRACQICFPEVVQRV